MSVLSVRLPKELDQVLPRKDRSAWVVAAIRQRLRRERINAIAKSAAEHAKVEQETLSDWEPLTAAAKPPLRRKVRR